jgi:hypothetical protein
MSLNTQIGTRNPRNDTCEVLGTVTYRKRTHWSFKGSPKKITATEATTVDRLFATYDKWSVAS